MILVKKKTETIDEKGAKVYYALFMKASSQIMAVLETAEGGEKLIFGYRVSPRNT